MTRDQSDKLYNLSLAAFPQIRGTDDGRGAAWAVLRIFEYSQCSKALVRLMREPRKFPVTPGEIVGEVKRREAEDKRAARGTPAEITDPRPPTESERKAIISKFMQMFEQQAPEVRARLGMLMQTGGGKNGK